MLLRLLHTGIQLNNNKRIGEHMEDNKMIAGMVVIGLTLITIAYISRDVPAPTAPLTKPADPL